MAGTVTKMTKMSSVKPLSAPRLRCMSRLAMVNHRNDANRELEGPAAAVERRQPDTASWWMPHPRTGIYFPKGHEWVMDDIPNDAALLDCAFWLRSIDGVDDHKSDNHNFVPINYPN